jgi:hypothetical protein
MRIATFNEDQDNAVSISSLIQAALEPMMVERIVL